MNPIIPQNPASETFDPMMEILLSNHEANPEAELSARVTPRSLRSEDSWNGLFLTEHISEPVSTTICTSNKKMGHTSFTDLGVYEFANETTKPPPFMRLRLERMLKSTHEKQPLQDERFHNSDSALLRRDSSMDTSDLEGAWYRAKHPHSHCLEQMAHSAPAGSALDFVPYFAKQA